jgi:hypothetical protein
MNATRVSIRAGRRSGKLTILILLALTISQARASEITVTVTGTLMRGNNHGIFGPDPDLTGKPFTVVFRFDDSNGRIPVPPCEGTSTGFEGMMPYSHNTATLTINGISYEFGKAATAHSGAWRSIASRCSASQIRFQVDEGTTWANRNEVNVVINPNPGPSLTQNPDWRAELSTTAIAPWTDFSMFMINHEDGKAAIGAFIYKSVTISRSK